jgi:ribosomal protein S18 acetylase RimI-like enzyme
MSSDSTRFYKHYKNKPYKLLGTVRHSETLEEMALYETLYENQNGRMWVRPKDMFFENVVIDGVTKPRFEKIKFTFIGAQPADQKTLEQIKQLHLEAFGEPLEKTERFTNKLLALTAFENETLVAFKLGYALDATTFYSWLGAVKPAYRQLGLASELMRMQHAWCLKNGFNKVKTKTHNKFKDMLKLNINSGFEITGVETKPDGDLRIIMNKKLEN